MKRFLLLMLAWSLTSVYAFSAGTNEGRYSFNFQRADLQQVLDIYKKLSGFDLEIAPNANVAASIDLETSRPLTKDEAIKLFEKTMKEQAGIVVTRLDDKRASVTFDPSVRIAPVKQKEPPQPEKIILTAMDVDPKSVRVTTPPSIPSANLVFQYVGKTSDEIKAIGKKRALVQIEKDGVVVAETHFVSLYSSHASTNYIGLVLIFDDYNKAKLAEKTLRGD